MTAAAAVARSLGIGGIAIEGAAGAVRCSPLVSGRRTFEDSFFLLFSFRFRLRHTSEWRLFSAKIWLFLLLLGDDYTESKLENKILGLITGLAKIL